MFNTSFNTLFYRVLLHSGIAFLAMLSVFSFANAQTNREPMSLNRAVSLTLAQNPQLHQFSIKKQGLLGQRLSSDLLPALSLSVDVENLAGSGELAGANAMETTVALSSVIELGGRRRARVSVADAQLNLLGFRRQAFTLDVLGDLAAVFINILEQQEHIKLVKESQVLAQNTLATVRNRSRQGAAPESEAKRAAAFLAQVQLQLDALKHQHERSRVKLASFWGDTSPSWQEVKGNLYAFEVQPSFSELYQRALSSPAINLFASEQRLKTAQLQLAKTQSKTDLSWQVGVRQFEDVSGTAFTAGMSIPLFSGRRNRGAVAVATANRDEVEYQSRAATLRLHARLFEAYSQRQQHLRATEVFQSTIIPKLTSASESTQRAYETGRYSYQDWMAAQQELIEAKQTLVESAAAAALNQAVIEQLVAEPLGTAVDSD